MSNYVWGSHLSPQDYIQAKQFVGEITGASREAGRRVSMEVSRQTREIVASQEALAREQITVAEQSTHATQEGFQTLSYGLSDISSGLSDASSGISELNATFHWGFFRDARAVRAHERHPFGIGENRQNPRTDCGLQSFRDSTRCFPAGSLQGGTGRTG